MIPTAVNSGIFVKVKRLPRREVELLRQEYKKNKCSLTQDKDKNVWDTHHKVPLSLSGDNSPDNLAVMNKYDHADLHREFLDPQTKDLHTGDTGIIFIPTSYDVASVDFAEYQKMCDYLLENHILDDYRKHCLQL